jgi:ABC-2 type transport system permease protein
MRTIRFLLKKEFLQIFRNRSMLPLIFVMPVVQLIILSNAATFEIKNISFEVVDFDRSSFSRELVSRFTASGYFTLNGSSFSVKQSEDAFKKNKARLIINIPEGFEKDYRKDGRAKLQLVINAEDGNAAGLIYSYSAGIIQQFGSDIITEWSGAGVVQQSPMINITFSNWFNPKLNYKTYMVPGILVVLVTMIGMFLTGMNIAREKEMGTIEQLNVTPIKKYHFIIGKLLPFWIIALFELTFGLTLGRLAFDVPVVGSIFLIFISAAVYLFIVLGMGLLISTVTDTQQQAMFIAWFFMVIFILMGGLFTSVEAMPAWAQTLNTINPIAHFNRIMRMIMLKGSGLNDIANTLYFLAGYALLILSLAVWRYRKVT